MARPAVQMVGTSKSKNVGRAKKPVRGPTKASGWLMIKNAPLETIGYVFSFDPSWFGRTDITGQVFAGTKSRFVSSSAKGYVFTHWHPLLKPPRKPRA